MATDVEKKLPWVVSKAAIEAFAELEKKSVKELIGEALYHLALRRAEALCDGLDAGLLDEDRATDALRDYRSLYESFKKEGA